MCNNSIYLVYDTISLYVNMSRNVYFDDYYNTMVFISFLSFSFSLFLFFLSLFLSEKAKEAIARAFLE